MAGPAGHSIPKTTPEQVSPLSGPSAVSTVVLDVTSEWHVARVRNAVRGVLQRRGFSRVNSAYVETAVSELAANLFFHATHGGRISFQCAPADGGHEVIIVAEDDGPGIPDVEQARLDGFSTNGGLGGGLPGVERLMDEIAIESSPGSGTRVRSRKWVPCR